MSFPLGGHHRKKKVQCRVCGKALFRKTWLAQARCRKCQPWRSNEYSRDYYKALREQARRYRIILHALGWEGEQFAEMLAEMRASPMAFRKTPETRAARIDVTHEKRARAREKRAA